MSATVARVELTREQREVVDRLVWGIDNNHVQTLGGFAGCGKTVCVTRLTDFLPRFAVCAYTGKAADVLRRKGVKAATIHSTIYRPEEDRRGKMVFHLKSQAELGYNGFLIDEASMVSNSILDDLKSFGLPIIAVGDHGQLPPVGEDAGLMKNPDYRLETIHRNAGPIARFAEHLRKGGDARSAPISGDSVHLCPRNWVTTDWLVKSDQVICAFNRTRIGLNRTIRRSLGRTDDDYPTRGDRVICLRNDRIAGTFNGQQGVCGEVNLNAETLEFIPEYGEPVLVYYHPLAWNAEKTPPREPGVSPGFDVSFDFAYCVTAHKFQGSEANKVIVFEERCDLWEHSRWAYTAASRAKEKIVWAY